MKDGLQADIRVENQRITRKSFGTLDRCLCERSQPVESLSRDIKSLGQRLRGADERRIPAGVVAAAVESHPIKCGAFVRGKPIEVVVGVGISQRKVRLSPNEAAVD